MMYPEFTWWTGVVEDRQDPLRMGRCRVRIVGYHSPDMQKMPTTSLPWAVPMNPIQSASQTGVGLTPTGPVEGTHVVGFFRDGTEGQEPVIMGTLPGIPTKGGLKEGGPFKDNRWRLTESMYEATGNPDQPFQKNTSTGSPDIEGSVPRRPAAQVFIEEGTPLDEDGSMYQLRNEVRVWEFDPLPFPSGRLIGTPTMPRVSLDYNNPKAGHTFIQDPKEATRVKDISNLEKSQFYLKETTRKAIGAFPIAKSILKAAVNIDASFQEPTSFFKAKYPYNHAQETESGHLIEYDDTPKSERMNWYHRGGTFTEFGPNGYRINRTHGDQYDTTVGNNYEGTMGLKALTAKGIHMMAETTEIVLKGGSSATISMETGGGDIMMNAGGFMKVGAKRGILIDSDGGDGGIVGVRTKELQFDSAGNTDFQIDKTLNINTNNIEVAAGADISMSSMGNTNIAPKFGFVVKGGYSKEFYTNEYVGQGRVPFTDWNGKEIETMMGNIVLKVNTANPKLGGIELMVKTAPIPDMIDMPTNVTGLTYLKLNPLGTQALMMASPTLVDTTTTMFNVTAGALNTQTAGALTYIKSGAVTILDAPFHFIGGIGIEPALLGLTFATEYASHMHLSPSGPTSPPTTAAKVMTALSKKIFLGG